MTSNGRAKDAPAGTVLTSLGVGFRELGLTERELLTVSADDVAGVVADLQRRFRGAAVIATCNRFEVYVSEHVEREPLLEAIVQAAGFDRELASTHLVLRRDGEAIRHLYRVAAGLDSMVLGEFEILGQVRGALEVTLEGEVRDRAIVQLLHGAMRAGRRARNETGIARGHQSLFAVAADAAAQAQGDLAAASVLVVGAGEAAREAARAFADRGVSRFVVANRTLARAEEFASELDGLAIPLNQAASASRGCDVIVAATGAPVALLDRADIERARAARGGHRLVIVDLGVPRNVDAAARDVPGVIYLDVDSLREAAEAGTDARRAEIPQVEAIVEEEARRFEAWGRTRDVVPTVAALAERAEHLRVQQLEKAYRFLKPDEATRGHLDALTRALVKQILHQPIATLRGQAGSRYVEAAQVLFDVETGVDDVPSDVFAIDEGVAASG
jgi:glutamyl-tRNA reductase